MSDPQTEILDVKRLVGAWLPKELKSAYDDTFVIKWQDEEEYAERPKAPFATFRFMNPVQGRTIKNFRKDRRQVQTTETFTFADGQPDYQVATRDIDVIVSVTGTLAGVDHTFVQGTDYEKASSPNYTFSSDLLHWIDGGAKPDDDTDFVLTYKYVVIDFFSAQNSTEVVRLTLHVTDLKMNTDAGISRDYVKNRLCDQLYEGLMAFLTNNSGKNLAPNQGSLVYRGAQQINNLRSDKGESLSRRAVDIAFVRRQIVYRETAPRIGSVPVPVST